MSEKHLNHEEEMSQEDVPARTCPACKKGFAVGTRVKKHIERNCEVIKEALKQGKPYQEIRNLISTYKNQVQRKGYVRVRTLCSCVILGTDFCEKVVDDICWRDPITKFTTKEGRVYYRLFFSFVTQTSTHTLCEACVLFG